MLSLSLSVGCLASTLVLVVFSKMPYSPSAEAVPVIILTVMTPALGIRILMKFDLYVFFDTLVVRANN